MESLVRLLAPHAAAAVRAAMRRWGIPLQEEDCLDLVQESMLALLADDAKALRGFRWECPLPAYARTVALHQAMRWRRRRPPPAAPLERLIEQEGEAASPPGDALDREEEERRVRDAVDALPPRERRAIRSFYWEGASTSEIAWLLSVSDENARAILSRARNRLGERIGRRAGKDVTTPGREVPT